MKNNSNPVGSFLKQLLRSPATRKVLLSLLSIVGEKATQWLINKLGEKKPTGSIVKKQPMHQFSKTSEERLTTCHKDLQVVMNTAISSCPVDFGIAEGYRSVERQQELFNQDPPVTTIDGINRKSKHNYKPSKAVDIYAWVNGKSTYNAHYMTFLGGYIMRLADELFLSGKITHKIRWGGNWDRDGEIITDQTLVDLPHYEIID